MVYTLMLPVAPPHTLGKATPLIFARGEDLDAPQFALHGFGADTAALALNGVVAAINFYVGGSAGWGFQAA